MQRPPTRLQSLAAPLVVVALCATLAACDSGGGSRAARSTTTTTTKHRRKPHAATTTTSSSTTTTTTLPRGAQPDTAVTDPNVATTTTSPGGAAPCGPQEARLDAVVQSGELQNVPVASYTVTNCRLASSQPIWGAVTLAPNAGTSVAPLTVVFERVGSIWDVHSYGAGATGCDAPAPVPTQLGLGC
jgi:hypothetical protein